MSDETHAAIGEVEAEGRHGDELYGDARLRVVAEAHDERPSAVVEAILADVLAFQSGSPRDDIALVAVGVPDLS